MPPDGDAAEDAAPTVKPIAAVLQEQRDGAFHAELSEEFAELVRACMETGKKGSMTIKLSCAPQSDEATLFVAGESKVSAPKPDVRPSLFWPDADGNLLRSDPRQLTISNLREVPKAGAKEAKSA